MYGEKLNNRVKLIVIEFDKNDEQITRNRVVETIMSDCPEYEWTDRARYLLWRRVRACLEKLADAGILGRSGQISEMKTYQTIYHLNGGIVVHHPTNVSP